MICVDQQFTGLLLYAVNSAGARVGSWLLPPRQNFQIDPKSGCVTHTNAEAKNYKTVFRVKFPAGTGAVTIKALVKFGLAFPEARGGMVGYTKHIPHRRHIRTTKTPNTNHKTITFNCVCVEKCPLHVLFLLVAFYWPNNQHLQLTEGAPQQAVWFEGEIGQSCNTVCAKQVHHMHGTSSKQQHKNKASFK